MPARAAAILRVRLDVQRDGPVFSSSIAATLLKSRVRLGSVRREWQVPAILLLLLLFFFYLLMVLFALQICTLPNPGSSRGAHKFYYWAHWKGSVRTKNTLDNVLSRKSGVLLWKLSKIWSVNPHITIPRTHWLHPTYSSCSTNYQFTFAAFSAKPLFARRNWGSMQPFGFDCASRAPCGPPGPTLGRSCSLHPKFNFLKRDMKKEKGKDKLIIKLKKNEEKFIIKF